jgi:signal transduction histidine kinase
VTNHTPGAVTGAGTADREVDPVPVPPLGRQLQPRHWAAIDGVVAVLLAVVFLAGSTHPAYGIPLWVAYGLALVSTLPAAARRVSPLPVLGLVLAGSVASMAIGTGKDPSVVVAFVLYLVASWYRWRASLEALAGALALTVAGAVAGGAALSLDRLGGDRISGVASHILTSAVVIVAAWMIGAAVRQQRAYTAGLREQAERRVQAQLAQARREVGQERLRIARELHDVVAHGLSLIAMRAGVGHYVARARPEEAERALASIEATSRTALREMRRLVGVLRDGDPAGPGLEPAPGLADLGRLITGTADAGVRVRLEALGTRAPQPHRTERGSGPRGSARAVPPICSAPRPPQ